MTEKNCFIQKILLQIIFCHYIVTNKFVNISVYRRIYI